MARTIEQRLLYAIEHDDINAFNTLSDAGNYRLGRFPVLSLLYLYNAKSIIAAYEQKYIKISSYEELNEPAAITGRFAMRAGKCLRLYYDSTISPLEMLLILDKRKKLKALMPAAKPPDAVKARLRSIYYINYGLNVRFEGDDILFDRRPLGRKQKRNILLAAAGAALVISASVAIPVSIVSYINKHAFDVSSFEQIDLDSTTTYTLTSDIYIPANYNAQNVRCSIVGGGYTIVLGEGASLGTLNGALSNVKIQTFGNPIFTVCSAGSSLSGVFVKVSAGVETTDSSAFVALTNYGTFDGVTVSVSGKVKASAKENVVEGSEVIFGGMVSVNGATYNGAGQPVFGNIRGSSVIFNDLSLEGEVHANATFGGIAGTNNGYIQSCSVSGNITSYTFDVGGACYVNNNTVSRVVNRANLSQTADDAEWTPVVGGIAVNNARFSLIEYCQNVGDITVVGADNAVSGGISADNYGNNNYCAQSGDITVTAKTAFVGGIYGRSLIDVDGQNNISFGIADRCISQGHITANLGDDVSYVGGIGGFVQEGYMDYGYYYVYFGGGATNSVFTGGITGIFIYSGGIVGACGADIYDSNMYYVNDVLYYNFAGNYYLENPVTTAFGAVITTDEAYLQASDKGATPLTIAEIKNTAVYKDIVGKLGI